MAAKVILKGGENSLLKLSKNHSRQYDDPVLYYFKNMEKGLMGRSSFKIFQGTEEFGVTAVSSSEEVSRYLETKIKRQILRFPKKDRVFSVAFVCLFDIDDFTIRDGNVALLVYGKAFETVVDLCPGALVSINHVSLEVTSTDGSFSTPLASGTELSLANDVLSSALMRCLPSNLNVPEGTKFFMATIQQTETSHRKDFLLTKYLTALGNLEIELSLPHLPMTELQIMTRKILDDTDTCDFVIVAGDKTEHSCHRLFLTVNSDVFCAMIGKVGESGGSKFLESQTGRLEMKEMSGDGVQALLEYLYTRQIDLPTADPQIALELLMAGHMYNVKPLEDSMKTLILSWPLGWNSNCVEMAARLYLFAKNVDNLTDLKVKAVVILSNNKGKLIKSDLYKQLIPEIFPTTSKAVIKR